MLLAIIALSLLKLSLSQYSVGPDIYHGYNHAGSVHISGHMGPVRIIPVAASAYQSHVPYHHVINHEAPVYHVQTAPIAVHPVPVATYHVDDPGIIPVYGEPVIHHTEPAFHPDDVQEQVELVESPYQRENRNIALNLDFVPFELKMPVLSLSMRDPVKKPTLTKRKQHYLRYSERDPRQNFIHDEDELQEVEEAKEQAKEEEKEAKEEEKEEEKEAEEQAKEEAKEEAKEAQEEAQEEAEEKAEKKAEKEKEAEEKAKELEEEEAESWWRRRR